MKGELTIVWPDRPQEIRLVNFAIPASVVEDIIDDTLEIIPHWNQIPTLDNDIRRCVAVGSIRVFGGGPINVWATAMWHYIAKAKGHNLGLNATITGPVIVASGDEDFLNAFLE